MDDDLLQFLEDVFSGGGHDEGHGVGVGQSIILAKHPQQTAADLAVGGQGDFHVLIFIEQDVFWRLADTRLPHIVVELMDFQVKFSFQGAASFTGDFCFNHMIHLLPQNKKAGRLFSEVALQRLAMYATGYRTYAGNGLSHLRRQRAIALMQATGYRLMQATGYRLMRATGYRLMRAKDYRLLQKKASRLSPLALSFFFMLL